MIYDIRALKTGVYNIHTIDLDSNIAKVYTDKTEIAFNNAEGVSSFEIEKNLECCDLLRIDTEVVDNLKFAEDWQIIDASKSVNKDTISVQTNNLDLVVKNIGYIKKVENMSDDRQYVVTLDGEYIGEDGFILEFIEKDINSGAHYILSYGKTLNLDQELYFKYNPFSNVLRLSDNTGMYFGITNELDQSTDRETDDKKVESIDITKLEIRNLYEPQLIVETDFNLDDLLNSKSENVEYKEVKEYLILGKFNVGGENNYLQYKQAYNPNWKLMNISENEYAKYQNRVTSLDYFKILIQSINGKSPENIEYYSNGWELKESENLFVLVFVPAVLSKVLLWVCSIAFATLILGIIYFKKVKHV